MTDAGSGGPGPTVLADPPSSNPPTRPAPPLRRTGRAAELGRFAVTGLAAFAVDVLVFNVLLLGLHAGPLPAKAASSALAIVVAFVGSRYYTWPGGARTGTARAAATFAAISVAAAGVQWACLWASHHALGLTSPWADNLSANVVGMGLGTALRFWAFRRFVFTAGQPDPAGQADPTDRPDPADPKMPPGAGRGPRPPRGRRVWPGRPLVTALVLLAWPAWSVGGTLLAPGTDPATARLAEWARFHGLGALVTGLEQVQYRLDPPRVGGNLAAGVPVVADPHVADPRTGHGRGAARAAPSPAAPSPAAPPTPAALAAIPVQAQPALPNEGQWQPLVTVRGLPALQAAFLRPDAQHTSYLVGVVSIDQTLVRLALHPGTSVPGGSGWSEPASVPPSELDALLATFNSGFMMADANGGYWQDGRSAVPLRAGAASMVLTTDGHLDVVRWSGGDPGPGVAAVRQNLDLLVDGGALAPNTDSTTTRTWGKTVGNATYVWRTALGIRADGSLVFVVGDSLSVGTLATIVRDAGAVRAMELDINKSWTNFMTYTHPSPGVAVPQLLTSDEHPFPGRYLQPSTRDFVTVLPR